MEAMSGRGRPAACASLTTAGREPRQSVNVSVGLPQGVDETQGLHQGTVGWAATLPFYLSPFSGIEMPGTLFCILNEKLLEYLLFV